MNRDAFTHIAIDASLFENTRAIGFQQAEQFVNECDEKLIKQIIEKGRFANKIAQALHKEQETETKYELPDNIAITSSGGASLQRVNSDRGLVPTKMQHLMPLDVLATKKLGQGLAMPAIVEEK